MLGLVTEQPFYLHLQTSLLAQFPPHAILCPLAGFSASPGQQPIEFSTNMFTMLDKQQLAALDDRTLIAGLTMHDLLLLIPKWTPAWLDGRVF
jgi:hypothetical protein